MPDDFHIEAILHEGLHHRVCRAIRLADGEVFILKSIKPGGDESRLAHEKRVWERLGVWKEGVVFLRPIDGVPTLGRPASDGTPVDRLLVTLPTGLLTTRMRLFRGICRALVGLHERGVIHKNICPANLLWDEDSGTVEIVDFAIAALLQDEATEPAAPSWLEGTPAYLSPEQTGRLRRSIDARTDLYSLGATAYEIFSGRPPFVAGDLAALVHSHLATVPEPLTLVAPGVPVVLSDLVGKLLNKEPERRYLTATGLLVDVERCLWGYDPQTGVIAPFPLGEEDTIRVFQVPERLYGRGPEVDRLLRRFSEAAEGAFRMVLLSGYSGIGKTALVNEVQAPVLQWRGRFASGKFDQLRRDVPYGTLVQAFRRLIRQTLKESNERVAELKRDLESALGDNGRLLVDMIPELEWIVGPQPEVPQLSPAEIENRFFRTLMRFVKVFANERSPLVLFLDDLQWADQGTLTAMERFAGEGDFGHLMLIGAYRDNEVGEGHPLGETIGRLRGLGAVCEEIEVTPLSLSAAAEWIADTLHRDVESVSGLAAICLEKTDGNPFFLNQFLRSLHDQGSIWLDGTAKRWTWDEAAVRDLNVTENVVDLMSRRIALLDAETRGVVRLAAAVGNPFELEHLSTVARLSVVETMKRLWGALDRSFVLPVDARYRYAGLGAVPAADEAVAFRFLHDRVQQACYAEIPEDERPALHLEIGRLLMQRLDGRQLQDRLFEVVNHYNSGRALIEGREEKRRLAELNLAAGRRARDSAAYSTALGFFETALALCAGEVIRESDHALCFQIHIHTIQARYLCLDYDGMDRLAVETTALSRTPIEVAAVAEIRIQSLMARNQPVAAIELALPVLRSLGVRLPARPGTAHIVAGLAATEWRLRGKPVARLADLPPMTDPEALAAMRILYAVFSSCYFALPRLYPLIMYEIIRLTLAHGITPAAAVGFSAYGVVHCGLLRKIERGNEFGELSLDLVDRFAAREIEARVVQVTQGFVTVWRTHPEELLSDFAEASRAGLDTGDFEFAAFTAHMRCFYLLWTGKPLDTVGEEMRRCGELIAGMKQSIPSYQHALWRQFAANLRGEAAIPTRMTGEHYDEVEMVAIHEAANDAIALFFLQVCNLVLGVLFDDLEAATGAAEKGLAMNRRGVGLGSTTVPIFFQFSALAWAGLARQRSGRERRRCLARARRAIRSLRPWARCSPLMAAAKLALAEAELAAAEDRPNDAIGGYLRAAELGRLHRSPIDSAVALHRMAEFHRERGHPALAITHLREACHEYERWQADGLLTHLRAKYRPLADAAAPLAAGWIFGAATAPLTRGDAAIDLSSVVKSAQALSGEIILDQLLRKLMRIMMENAGADRGALVLLKEGKLVIEAQGGMNGEEIRVLQSIPITGTGRECPPVPVEVIQFVARTQETVILEDAAQIGAFTTDPFIASHRCRSMIAIPLINRGRLTGVLELQNTSSRGVFSPERVSMLQALSAQAAISIENARLYSGLDELNRAYARFVPHEFLDILDKRSITDVSLGDQIQGTMSVMFSDIHDFTRLSETMSPAENFQFVNHYLNHMGGVFENRGFIDKYVGDGIMGIFPRRADDAVEAGLEMLRNLAIFNEERRTAGASPIAIGIGINTGSLMLGVVGGPKRLDTTVISDSVNLSSRLEALTREYGVPLLISEHTYRHLGGGEYTDYIRKIDRVAPKGRTTEIDVFEIFAGDPPPIRDLKALTALEFQEAWREMAKGRTARARELFREIGQKNPGDRVVQYYLDRLTAETPAPFHAPAGISAG